MDPHDVECLVYPGTVGYSIVAEPVRLAIARVYNPLVAFPCCIKYKDPQYRKSVGFITGARFTH